MLIEVWVGGGYMVIDVFGIGVILCGVLEVIGKGILENAFLREQFIIH